MSKKLIENLRIASKGSHFLPCNLDKIKGTFQCPRKKLGAFLLLIRIFIFY